MSDPVYVIAEYGTTSRGMLDVAHAQVDAAVKAGARAFKTQLLAPEYIAAPDAPAYWHHAKPGQLQRDSFAGTGNLPYNQWAEIVEHCYRVGIDFVASPFDLYAVEILAQWPSVIYKIASGDLTNVPLLRAVKQAARRQIIVSTGAATEAEVFAATQILTDSDIVWLACTLEYPTPIRNAELARVRTLRQGFGIHTGAASATGPRTRSRYQVGYSDHVGKPASAMGAVFMGATHLEVHTTLTPGDDTPCPDDAMALDPAHLATYIEAANTAAMMVGDGVLGPLPEELPARDGARRSVHFARSLPAGHRLTEGDLICLRPAGGVSPLQWDELVGRELTADVHADDRVTWEAIA